MKVGPQNLTSQITKALFILPAAPNLHWVAHIENNIAGDQLTSQILRLMPERTWLFKYGRMPLNIIMNETMIYKVDSRPLRLKYRR